jgi:hypothetical protein
MPPVRQAVPGPAALDPAGPDRGAIPLVRRARAVPDRAVPDRGAFEPPPKARPAGERRPLVAVPRDMPEPAAKARAQRDRTPPALVPPAPPIAPAPLVTPVPPIAPAPLVTPVPPIAPAPLVTPVPPIAPAPPVPPESTAKSEPSWGAALANTARLWAQRRARRAAAPGGRSGPHQVLIAAALVLVVAGGLTFALSGHGPASPAGSRPGAGADSGAAAIATATAVRYQAAGWVAQQVSRDANVACDPVMCAALHSRGFPAANLVPILPSRPDPLGAEILIATAAIRDQFRARLAEVYAPLVIASFGAGQARIEIRTIPPEGAAAFRRQLGSDEQAARRQGAQILSSRQIVVSTQARAALAAGRVDKRLLATLVILAAQHPVRVVAFGDADPGAGPGIPLRSAVLAGADRAAGLRPAAYQRWLLAYLQAQRSEYRATSVGVGQAAVGGGTVVRIEFAAPSP